MGEKDIAHPGSKASADARTPQAAPGREFGHISSITSWGCIDSWGVGPFIIVATKGTFRFFDSDRFGPYIVTARNDPAAKQPGDRSPFWQAHRCWVRQGRRLASDGITCIWDAPAPMIIEKRGRSWWVVEHGEEDGAVIKRDGAARVHAEAGGLTRAEPLPLPQPDEGGDG